MATGNMLISLLILVNICITIPRNALISAAPFGGPTYPDTLNSWQFMSKETLESSIQYYSATAGAFGDTRYVHGFDRSSEDVPGSQAGTAVTGRRPGAHAPPAPPRALRGQHSQGQPLSGEPLPAPAAARTVRRPRGKTVGAETRLDRA